ncbi:hypothetical protein MY9_1442 [Bacillus sp. JS]|nr:hypothetical protein MY9_1442 [Bacillus sp. JS]
MHGLIRVISSSSRYDPKQQSYTPIQHGRHRTSCPLHL